MFFLRILLITTLLPCVGVVSAEQVAREIRSIIITGSSLNIGVDDIISMKKGSLTDREIEALGVAITNRYHSHGYTTSYVKKIFISGDGKLEFQIEESRIAGIHVSGISREKSKTINDLLTPLPPGLYNRFWIEERTGIAQKALNLSSVSIRVENIENSGDVRLEITARENLPLTYRGGMIFEPIYGATPMLELTMPLGRTVLTAGGVLGVREGEIKKMEGTFRVYTGAGSASWAFFSGYTGSRRIETWESAGISYRHTSHTPAVGLRYLRDVMLFEISANYAIIDIVTYPDIEKDQRDMRLDVLTAYSNSHKSIIRQDSTEASVAYSVGRGSIIDSYYQNGHVSFRTTFSPVVWLKIKPRVTAYSTTSDSRYYWSYVFDGNLQGFYDDFTASRRKVIAGTGIEYEIIPEQFYCGPFFNSGRYINESGSWKTASGAGVSGMMLFSNFTFQAHYAWDITRKPGDGGFFISLEGSF
jgi:hypothetical protein